MHPEGMARDPWITLTVPPASISKPLNSKRLTNSYLLCIAKAMRPPTRGTVEEMRLIIEGQLKEMEHEPCNVQDVDEGGGEIISLCDVSGMFLETRHVSDEANREGAVSVVTWKITAIPKERNRSPCVSLFTMCLWQISSMRVEFSTES